MNPKMPLQMPPKMLILEFVLKQKMNQHFRIKFHDKSNGNSLKAEKLNNNTLIALIGLNYPKYGLCQLRARTKVIPSLEKFFVLSRVEFQDKSNEIIFIFQSSIHTMIT